ncbi:glycine--tRNA ligase subunit beta [Xinfangfangia sp. CPCC 101601]|uniref:Glycine--tRNA ligase beta subunit n=1 Tax=Pseudogemmobacter lacusdianii TaxID=3069608 RepID=A0ABU0VWG2_9RHOB|nr:glycine--tRNA ligase subunit beta [Xinfangfangia sp. CPCC 101601]MDQ2065848.1 glycine--tRNA ligase subunit beta [Xinfangfangia sp. CPCC 101601]
MPDLLIELFSEEIPARMQGMARDELKKRVTDGLVEAGLTYASAGAFSTPRRLVLALEGLTAESRPVREERKGPNVSAPAAALEGFLRSTGLTVEQLEKRADKKGEVWFAVVEKPGRQASEIVAEVLEATIRNFPWPKSMRWGAGALRWVRPLHSILCILTDEAGASVVPMTVEGITSGNETEGHRFMGAGRFAVSSYDDYVVKLRRAKVMLDTGEREQAIWTAAQNLAFAQGLELVEDRGLLTEVAGLVEWPVPLMGRIADEFLGLPAEVLQTSMKEHQKFFSVKNPKTGRIEGFVTVANIEAADHGATILKGNQKVLAARLSDARFFWENDLRVAKSGMAEWADGLKVVTFHNKLGSQADRIDRIAALAREIAPLVGADAAQAERAARIAKLDLRSAMVGEFPELQGTMGRYYALEAGETEAVANAARDHYSPLGPSDAVPSEPVSVAVALADKLDTLTGFWAVDEKPTGSKDPFALRRAALGVIRLVLGNGVRLGLRAPLTIEIVRQMAHYSARRDTPALSTAYVSLSKLGQQEIAGDLFDKILADANAEKTPEELRQLNEEFASKSADLLSFFHDRLKVFLRDQGIRHDVIDACLAMPGNDDLTLLVKRAEALAAVLKTEDGANLIQGFKRANNILSQAEAKDGVEYSFGADPKFAETAEESALFAALDAAEAKIGPAMSAEDFPSAMAAMAELRGPIDAFFTAVQINTENEIIRRNRLNLLHRIRSICSGVADLTRLEG